jgi:hypothetical protein
MLGRCRRHVLVSDAGDPRNRWAEAVHGYLTRDGIPPARLLALAREELQPYATQFVVVAAAEGAEAGMAINKALLEAELAAD